MLQKLSPTPCRAFPPLQPPAARRDAPSEARSQDEAPTATALPGEAAVSVHGAVGRPESVCLALSRLHHTSAAVSLSFPPSPQCHLAMRDGEERQPWAARAAEK